MRASRVRVSQTVPIRLRGHRLALPFLQVLAGGTLPGHAWSQAAGCDTSCSSASSVPAPVPRQAPRRPQARTWIGAGCTEVPVGQTWVLVLMLIAGVSRGQFSSSRGLTTKMGPQVLGWCRKPSGWGRRRTRLLFEAILRGGNGRKAFSFPWKIRRCVKVCGFIFVSLSRSEPGASFPGRVL